ncbi:MAG: ATPase, partial [Leptolyngbyaceae cyanobacterium CRU_2_3]|nr:ATPase [Leptolyngbyaceae cyanobacterium CRU_2_3]
MFKYLFRGAIVLTLLALPLIVASKKFDALSAPQNSVADPQAPHSVLTSSPKVFVHLFEWKWDDVAQECENFLAPNGYGAVQISPATEHVLVPEQGYPWWQRYQPISYKIESRSGDRAQFAQMVSRCHAVGVQVYADAVINHMAGEAQGIGSAGSHFTKYNYPGIYQPQDFHACKANIKNYGNHQEVTHCELVGLSDLDTGSETVRQRIAHHLIDLVHLGVDGFRIDAAKHMDTEDVGAIVKRV